VCGDIICALSREWNGLSWESKNNLVLELKKREDMLEVVLGEGRT
jgi:hypothetical protein